MADGHRGEELALVGSSRLMRLLRAQVARVGARNIEPLILGQRGVGKELVATAIHRASPRTSRPFITFSAADFGETGRSELQGHEAGSFTDAHKRHGGLLEEVGSGTLFLDEFGLLDPKMQRVMLRVLESRTYCRLGGTKSLRTDVHFIFAAQPEIGELIAAGAFRADLYDRAARVVLFVPSLAERREDIPELIQAFRNRSELPIPLTPCALELLQDQAWPGNVRQLFNVLSQIDFEVDDRPATAEDVVACIDPSRAGLAAPSSAPAKPLDAIPSVATAELPLEEDVRRLARRFVREGPKGDKAALWGEFVLEAAREEANGNQSEAARLLGMKRRTAARQLAKPSGGGKPTK